jgi:uncharacterized protein (DUF58 family)
LNKVSIKKILIKTRRQVFTEMIGSNASHFHGEGYDFAELREYQVGDDIRHIDWIITAKQNRPFVKVFHKEHQLNIVIATMLNGSVFFGTTRLKQELIAEVAAILAFSSIKNGDTFSHWLFADRLYSASRPTKKLSGVQGCVEAIDAFDPVGKKLDAEGIERELMLRLKRKSLIFLVGDFFTLPVIRALGKKHEVVALVVRDKAEEKLPDLGEIALIDPENGAYFEGEIGEGLKRRYEEKVARHDHEMNEFFKKNKIRWVKLYTDEDPFAKLARMFKE